jgi:hypothetical protein
MREILGLWSECRATADDGAFGQVDEHVTTHSRPLIIVLKKLLNAQVRPQSRWHEQVETSG